MCIPCNVVYMCIPCNVVYMCIPCNVVYMCIPWNVVYMCIPCNVVYMCIPCNVVYMRIPCNVVNMCIPCNVVYMCIPCNVETRCPVSLSLFMPSFAKQIEYMMIHQNWLSNILLVRCYWFYENEWAYLRSTCELVAFTVCKNTNNITYS